MQRVRLVQPLAVAVQRVVHHAQRVATGADHPFHDVQVGRRVFDRAEHDDAAALGLGVPRHAQEPQPRAGNLQLAAVDCLVDEQEVADQQRVLHARRGNAERLDQIGAEHDPDEHRHHDRRVPPLGPLVEGPPQLAQLVHGDRKLEGTGCAGNRDPGLKPGLGEGASLKDARCGRARPFRARTSPGHIWSSCCYNWCSHERCQRAAPRAAPARRPRQAVQRGQTARGLPVAGPQGRGGAGARRRDPGPDRRRGNQAGTQGDAAHLRGAQDRRQGDAQPAAGGPPGERFRSTHAPVAGREIGPVVTESPSGAAPPPATRNTSLDQLCINTVRTLAMDAVQQADSGHAGTAMALAPLAYVLWQRHLRYHPAHPDWLGRDRFVLSAGHACMLLYRPGHAIVDHCTYFLASDGDLMEGVSHEACSLAGHLKLGRLIGMYDDNRITIDGSTDLAFSDDTARRFESYGWHVERVADGNDLEALDAALATARRVADRPSLVIVRTHIAYGSPHKQDTPEAHGAPLGQEEVKLTKQRLGWPSLEPFYVPDEALAYWRLARERGARLEAEWSKKYDAYRQAFPDLAAELERRLAGRLADGWDDGLPTFAPPADAQATR